MQLLHICILMCEREKILLLSPNISNSLKITTHVHNGMVQLDIWHYLAIMQMVASSSPELYYIL